jgi:hypothetical protein
MFIETIPNRSSPPAVLLRESYCDESDKSQKRTLANLSKLPASLITGLKGWLKGGVAMPVGSASAGGGDIGRHCERGAQRDPDGGAARQGRRQARLGENERSRNVTTNFSSLANPK